MTDSPFRYQVFGNSVILDRTGIFAYFEFIDKPYLKEVIRLLESHKSINLAQVIELTRQGVSIRRINNALPD